MKKLLLFLPFLLLMFNVSCSSDDYNDLIISEPEQRGLLIGKWRNLNAGAIVEGTNVSDSLREKIVYEMDPDFDSDEVILTFNENMTGVTEYIDFGGKENFTYTLLDNLITIEGISDGEYSKETSIYVVNQTILSLTYEDAEILKYIQNKYPDAGITKTNFVYTYQRVK